MFPATQNLGANIARTYPNPIIMSNRAKQRLRFESHHGQVSLVIHKGAEKCDWVCIAGLDEWGDGLV
ncbi:predicted protein [Plenodomus lingam JN3]|uniref:Predicted protein n=1 Tax=Leptosphaeria maculans (strain JN3 / isolate v23.1.3 / race Av1-4-5-6-7-8) TaxID=985895 RepID=E5R4Q6_LEPMJ|nr:predicted protein [Plenodomus lingam JN3]CBX92179.1 predicted protein [Plenodomus lingam JN3]